MSRERIGDVAEVMLDYVEHNRTFQTDKIMTVPATSYTDPNQWRSEVDLIFKRVPLMLALSCEMPKPGDYKAMEAADLPVLMVRDKMGKVRAFLNVCAHRWSPVAAEGHGNCARFTCPFHGWTYALDGKLIGVADRGKFGDLDKSRYGLKELPCEERHGMIFVCLSVDTALDLDSYYGELLEEHAPVGLKDFTFLGSRVIEGPNWKITLNNFLETYHFSALHTETVAKDATSNVTHYEGFGPHIRVGFPLRAITELHDIPRAQWGEQEGRCFHFIRFLFPNVTTGISSDVSLFTQAFPGPSPDKSRLVLLFVRRSPLKGDDERERIARLMAYVADDITRDEDVAIGLKIQKALETGAHAGLLYGRNERGNQYFHEWMNWYLQRDPTVRKPLI